MIWANFLHFYQPPTQKKYWVDRITSEAYRRILHQLEAQPQARLSLNIAAVLLELWDKFGHHDVIEGYRRLIAKGQIEVTGSAKFHPLLPKLPDEEIKRQVILNELTLYKYLAVVGPVLRNREEANLPVPEASSGNRLDARGKFAVTGFFPPEMAFDRRLAEIVSRLGYDWVVCEELSLSYELGKVDYRQIYTLKGLEAERASAEGIIKKLQPLRLFFRDRGFSYKILSGQLGTANLFLDELGNRLDKKVYLLTAMDGETFGHHRPGMEKLLFELYRVPQVQTVQISQLSDYFRKTESVEVRPSTWALMEKDVEKKVPFARWDDPDNEIHKLQWNLTNLAVRAVRNSPFKIRSRKYLDSLYLQPWFDRLTIDPELFEGAHPESASWRIEGPAQSSKGQSGFKKQLSPEQRRWLKARLLLDKALHSDQYWWASARPWWSLEMIERGAWELLEAMRALPQRQFSIVNKLEAKKLYYQIITTGFGWQREGIVEERSRKEDEEIRMRTDEGLPKIPKKELKKMIKHLEEEMWQVVKNQEFERAAQLRDRVKELSGYLSDR